MHAAGKLTGAMDMRRHEWLPRLALSKKRETMPLERCKMCGRFTLSHTLDQIAARFDAEVGPLLEAMPRYNIAPTQPVAVVLQNGTRYIDVLKWGLVPSWAKDPSIGSRLINARAETLAEKPSFRTALARRRCLVPASGFYEWKEADNPEEGGKTPQFIHAKDGGLLAFAGLWDEWTEPDGSPLRTCTIITTAPNQLMASIHDRMPVILAPEDEGYWLDGNVSRPQDLLPLLVPAPADILDAYPVSRRVNSPAADDISLVARVS